MGADSKILGLKVLYAVLTGYETVSLIPMPLYLSKQDREKTGSFY